MKKLMIVPVAALALLQAGCLTTPKDQSTALGAGIGAGLGAILGNNFGNGREERAMGAAAGALIGGVFGRQYGQQQETQNQVNYLNQQMFMTTVWIANSNGSRTPIQLRQTEGGQYIGPRGEYYSAMPTEDQLRKVYGM